MALRVKRDTALYFIFHFRYDNYMSKKILVIDDEEDILEAVKIILESRNFDVTTLTDFKSSSDVVTYKPDLILLDFLLVGKNGKEVCAALKNDAKTADIPIIILSAHPLSKLRTFISPSDVVGYIQKPFDMSVLIAAVEASL